MATFKDPTDTTGVRVIGELTVIAKYFRKSDESIADFREQTKGLSTEDKTELAIGAAKELGIERID